MNRAPQSPIWLMIVLGVSILITETGIMYLFQLFTPPSWVETYLDGIFLTILVFPVLYLLVFRPMNHYISKLNEVDEGLRASEERFRKLFENSNDAIFIHTIDGRILDANHQAEDMMGYPLAVLKSMQVPALHPPEELEASKKAFEETISKGSARFESRFLHSGGAIINVEISSRIVDSEKGIIQGVVRDITARKKTEAELKRVNGEIQEKSKYLERFNRLMVGRELEMINLKAEVNELLEKDGQPKKYESPDEVKEEGI